ncbi:MAG: lipopolysaccharide biosynthesis protein [Thiobacillus sp.]
MQLYAGAAVTHDLARRSLSALLWNYAGGGGKAVAQLLIQIVLARMLGPEVFGQYSAVLVVLGIGWLFADSGFGSALIQKHTLEESDVSQALGWVLLLASIIASAIAGLAPWLADQFSDRALIPMFQASAVLIFLQALSNISASLMRRELDMKRLQIIQLGAYLIGFGVVAMVLAYRGMGAWSLIIGFGVQAFLSLAGGLAVVRHSLRPSLRGDAKLRDFGVKVLMVNLVNWAIENMDRFLVGKFWGVQALGLYAVAFNLSRSPVAMLVGSFQAVAFSSASRIQEDDARICRGYLAVLSLLMLVLFPAFAVISYEADAVVELIYGAGWRSAAPLLAAFAITTPIYALGAVTGPLLTARSAMGKEFNAQFLILVVLMVGFVLLREAPLASAVWIVPVAYALRFIFLFLALRSVLPIPLRSVLRALFAGILLAAAGLFAAAESRFWMAEAAWGNLFPLFAGATVILLLMPVVGGKIIGSELRTLLSARQAESRVVRVFCRLLGLPGLKG